MVYMAQFEELLLCWGFCYFSPIVCLLDFFLDCGFVSWMGIVAVVVVVVLLSLLVPLNWHDNSERKKKEKKRRKKEFTYRSVCISLIFIHPIQSVAG